jgi:hypothetical protein
MLMAVACIRAVHGLAHLSLYLALANPFAIAGLIENEQSKFRIRQGVKEVTTNPVAQKNKGMLAISHRKQVKNHQQDRSRANKEMEKNKS